VAALGAIYFLLPVPVQQEWVVLGTIVSELINLNIHNQPPVQTLSPQGGGRGKRIKNGLFLVRRNEGSVQPPTWLGLGFRTACTTGYCRHILGSHDDSSIVTACCQGALTLLEEDEAKGSVKQSQLAAAKLCCSTSEHVPSDLQWM